MSEARGADDPKGLIAEAYRIEGISEAECRSIFLDWALSLPSDASEVIPKLLEHRPPDHPMSRVLREGMGEPARRGRRGGWQGRRRS
ncbi:hypothetical protein JSE7799_02322 [Jannaschia seosinensis]|uniref:Uncharacterized protein n=1 Tax=Jannaschia seosinensis TaxID=313367 RepID=A0A0M7BE14_9RHOB|nr:hypothetical protein [Jannaschia seosinensis]CUH39595.1 hypothetical protein JSE7799_02322 [Jannaschia seosinensis]